MTEQVNSGQKNPKKILIFSLLYYPRFIGGAEVAIKEITDRLDPAEYEFDMIALRFDRNLPKVEKIGNITVHRIGFTGHAVDTADTFKFPLSLNKYLYVPLAFCKAISLHFKNKYDAIWSMMATYNSFAAILFKFLNPRLPYLLTLQEGDPISFIKRRALPLYPLFVAIFRRADHIQVLSEYLASYAREMGYKGEVTIVPNGVTYEYFARRDEVAIAEIKQRFNKKSGDFWIATTSRLVHKNAVDDVILALPLLPPEVKFLVLGTGPERESLEALAEEAGVASRVHFLGHIDHSSMPAYLHASDCFIRPSRSEGFGVSFIESMAAGLPIIATAEGGIVDFLFHKETGLICGTNDPTDVAHKIVMYMKDVDLREEVIDKARALVQEKYDWHLITEQVHDVFKKLLA